MKKVYQAPAFDKISFVSEDAVCSLFGDLFQLNMVDSANMVMSSDSIFQWEAAEESGQ